MSFEKKILTKRDFICYMSRYYNAIAVEKNVQQ